MINLLFPVRCFHHCTLFYAPPFREAFSKSRKVVSFSGKIVRCGVSARLNPENRRDRRPRLIRCPSSTPTRGSGFNSKIFAEYLSVDGIKHIFARPYHPYGGGKIERFHRRIKEKVCLMVYCSPREFRKALN